MFKKKQWCSPEHMKSVGLIALRLALGIVFIRHGWMKLTAMDGVVQMVANIGFFAPTFWAWVLALVEFVGGIMVLVGFFPKLAAKFLIIDMVVALLLVHAQMPYQSAELPIALLGGLLALLGAGAGNWVVSKKDCTCGICFGVSK